MSVEAKRRYMVLGPERGEVIPILDDGTGPMEYGRAYAEFDAASAREARRMALRHSDFANLVDEARSDGRDPRGYIAVFRIPPQHQCPYEDDDNATCAVCDAFDLDIAPALKKLDEKLA